MATTTKSEIAPRAQTLTVRGYVLVLLSTMLMSTTGILIKLLLTNYNMEPLALAFLRVFFVSSALGIVLLVFRRAYFRVQSRHLIYFILMGILGVGMHQLFWVTSVQLNGAGIATVLVYVQPTIVALISIRFLGEQLDRNKVIALVLTLVGIILVSQAYNFAALDVNGLGILVGIGTGFTWAAYALLGRYTSIRYPAWTSLFYAFAFGALLLLPLQLLVKDTLSLGTNWTAWAVLLFLSLGPTLGGFGLYTVGLSQVPASVVTLIGTLEPFFTIITAFFLFNERLDLAQLIGAGLILLSVILLRPRTPTESFDS